MSDAAGDGPSTTEYRRRSCRSIIVSLSRLSSRRSFEGYRGCGSLPPSTNIYIAGLSAANIPAARGLGGPSPLPPAGMALL